MAYGDETSDDTTPGRPGVDRSTDPDSGGGDATRPVGRTVPQAARPRPAGPSAVASPATHAPTTGRSDPPRPRRLRPVTAGRRARSALGVVLMVVAVGVGLAAALGVVAVFVSRALEGAVS